MADINLLPKDIAPKGPVNKVANTLKKIAIYASVALVVFLAGAGGYIFYIQSQIRNTLSSQERLEESIKSLEQTEQRVVLLKDRIKRANSVLAEDTATPALDSFEELSLVSPQSATLAEAEITTETTEVSYVVTTSSDLAQLMAALYSVEGYEKIELTSFGFSPSSGYLVGLVLK